MLGFFKDFRFSLKIMDDERAQGSVELILILGGLIIIVLLLVYIYKSYMSGLGDEINSSEVQILNNSFSDISARFQ